MKIFGSKTALGIDISDSRISMALLQRGAGGIELVKAANATIAEGTIKDGNIEDADVLAKAIKELCGRNSIQSGRVAVSLPAKPLLVQILDMPKQVPVNVGHFVSNEVKQCVALAGREIAFDFCGIGSGVGHQKQLFVVSTDGQKVNKIAKVCNQAGLNVSVIEPALPAYIRAFHTKKIAGKFDCNLLLAILRGGVLTLCVFKKQTLDFVRVKDINKGEAEPAELCKQLVEEINTIIQFYDVDVTDSADKWEITVIVGGSSQLPADAEQTLRTGIPGGEIQVKTDEGLFEQTILGESGGFDGEKPSAVAIGLAMKLLEADEGIKVNLLPPESVEVKIAKRDALMAANALAVALVIMILLVCWFKVRIRKVNADVADIKQTKMFEDIRGLIEKRKYIDREMAILSVRPAQVEEILNSRDDIGWAMLLEDIRMGTPRTLQVTKMFCKGSSRMFIEGVASSYETVRLFVSMLKKSEHISQASLIEAEKGEGRDGLVNYIIQCSLKPRKVNAKSTD
jgi:hypothetical protein